MPRLPVGTMKYTNYDKTDTYEEQIQEKIQEILRICNKEQIPIFISVAVKNGEKGTKYINDMYASATNDVFLKDDYFPNYINVSNGFRTIPPSKVVEIDFD